MANYRVRTKVNSSHSTEEAMDNMKAAIVQLRLELESERKSIRQLRRERTNELQLAREQEQDRAAAAMKEMAAKLQQAKEQETRLLRCRLKSEIDRVFKQKDREIKKLRKDLVKCRDDLEEETYRRGLSSSARGAFELERSRMLQEIRELNASKKHAEDALCSALEAAKQKSLELRQLQDTMRREIAKVNREANAEIKRILEEMKAKDQSTLMMTKRGGGGGEGGGGGSSSVKKLPVKCLKTENQSVHSAASQRFTSELESWKKNLSAVEEGVQAVKCWQTTPNFTLQRKLYDLEKQLKYLGSVRGEIQEKNSQLRRVNKEQEQRIGSLIEGNKTLNLEVKSAKGEIKRLKDLTNQSGINDLTSTLEDLCDQIKSYENMTNSKKKESQKKSVRFLLACEDQGVSPVNERYYDDGGGGGEGGGGIDLRDEEKANVPLLPAAVISTSENLTIQDWHIQREALNIVIQSLEEKLKKYEENEDALKIKLTEACDRNEELEFQILELENSADEKNSQWQKENESLKSDLSNLENRLKLINKESNCIMERNVATQCDQEMLNSECLEQKNSFHDLTDDHKLSVRSKAECSDYILPVKSAEELDSRTREVSKLTEVSAGNLVSDIKGQDSRHDVAEGGGDDDHKSPITSRISESRIESLVRKLMRSQIREQQMKDQLILLAEEKNRHIKLLQYQIECLENQDHGFGSSSSRPPLLTKCRADEIERPSPEGLEDGENQGSFIADGAASREERGQTVLLKLDTTLHWIPGSTDAFDLTPSTGDCNVSRKLEYSDSRQEQLCRQISDLERDREILQEVVHNNESTIHDLRTEVDKLQQSEKDLQRIVNRLENAEEQLRAQADHMAACNADMEQQLKRLKDSENALLSSLKKSRSIELELKVKVEEMTDEKYVCDEAWKRRLLEADIEKRIFQEKITELTDQIGDLEASEYVLKQKLKRKEKAESCLTTELEEVKRDFNITLNHVSEMEYEKEMLMQKLEKANVDLTTEIIRREQEKEAMSVEMIELDCKIKVLEQSVSGKGAIISALESKLLELESDQKKMQRNHEIRFTDPQCVLRDDGRTFPLELRDQLKDFEGCCYHGNNFKEGVNNGKLLDDVTGDDANMSLASIGSFLSSHEVPSDEVESADEASEIVDEDDGAHFEHESGSVQFHHECWSSSSCARMNRSTDSPTLDSVCDSGMESLKQDCSQGGSCLAAPLITYKPNAYKCRSQSSARSLIPVSVRYLTKNRTPSSGEDL